MEAVVRRAPRGRFDLFPVVVEPPPEPEDGGAHDEDEEGEHGRWSSEEEDWDHDDTDSREELVEQESGEGGAPLKVLIVTVTRRN